MFIFIIYYFDKLLNGKLFSDILRFVLRLYIDCKINTYVCANRLLKRTAFIYRTLIEIIINPNYGNYVSYSAISLCRIFI